MKSSLRFTVYGLQFSTWRNIFLFLILSLSASAQRSEFSSRAEGDTVVVNKKVYTIHKCAKDETVFTIASKFHVSVNDIDNANKDVINNLKKNTVLLIPVSKKKENAKKEEAKAVSHKDQTYKIALLIPFNEGINYTADSTLVNGYSLNASLERETVNNLEFYEGILIAVDSLKKKDFKAHVTVVDAYDSTTVMNAKAKEEVKGADMIIINLGQNLAGLLSHFVVNGKPIIISCGTNTSASLKGDSSAFFTAPSSLLQCRQMGEHYAMKKGANDKFIILTTSSSKEIERANAFNISMTENDISVDKVKLDSTTQPLKPVLGNLVMKGKNNVVILPTTDEAFASNVISYLKTFSAEYEITLVGLPTWQYFQSVNPEDLQLLHTTIFSAVNISYESTPVVAFRKNFRNKYSIEPSENAFTGYDAMLFFGEQLLNHGISFSEYAMEKNCTGLSTDFYFVKEKGGNGFENNYISVLRFENYSLKKINK